MSPNEDNIRMCIKRGFNTTRKIAVKLKKPQGYIAAYITGLVDKGAIKRVKCPTCGVQSVYSLAEK